MPGSTTRRRIVAAILGATLWLLGGALAAGPASAAIPGGIAILPGTPGCVVNGGGGGLCTSSREMGSAYNVAVSPDGKHVYSASFGSSVLTFDRNQETGALTQKTGTAGCLRSGAATGDCKSVPGLGFPWAIEITPDGSSLYVASITNGAVLAFDRDRSSGELTQKTGPAGCINNAGNGGCRDARAMPGPYGLTMDADGKHLYVASYGGDSVTALAIDSSGGLNQIQDGPGGAGCAQNTPDADACADGRAMNGALSLDLNAAGTALHVGSFDSRSLSSLSRDPSTGRLSPVGGPTGCIVPAAAEGCTTDAEVGSSYDIISGRNGELYAAFDGQDRVVTYDTQSNGGLVRRAGVGGCVANGGVPNCGAGRGLDSPTGIALSADGEDVYVTSSNSSSIVELDRAGSALTARADARGCVSGGGLPNCATATNFSAWGVAISPDDKYVYATSPSGRISVFKRDSGSPSCSTSEVTVQAGSVGQIPFPCTDRDGDAFNVAIINPPTLGGLGALDNAAHTIVYAAPQGQNGSTTLTFKAAYPDGTFTSGEGSITINVVGAPPTGGGGTVLPAGIDNDKDGFPVGLDCNDANAAIRPGVVEVKGNRVDENCDTIAEPFPTLAAGVATSWDAKGNSITLKGLQVTQQFPRGWSVKILCKGSKCPFKSKTLKKGKVKRSASNVITSLSKKQRKFRAGQTVEVWVSAPNFNTKVSRYALKKGKIPTTQPFCVLPGQTRPQKTCT